MNPPPGYSTYFNYNTRQWEPTQPGVSDSSLPGYSGQDGRGSSIAGAGVPPTAQPTAPTTTPATAPPTTQGTTPGATPSNAVPTQPAAGAVGSPEWFSNQAGRSGTQILSDLKAAGWGNLSQTPIQPGSQGTVARTTAPTGTISDFVGQVGTGTTPPTAGLVPSQAATSAAPTLGLPGLAPNTARGPNRPAGGAANPIGAIAATNPYLPASGRPGEPSGPTTQRPWQSALPGQAQMFPKLKPKLARKPF